MDDQFKELSESLISFMQDQLSLPNRPKVKFQSDPENAIDPLGKTAFYVPNEQIIVLLVDKRHTKDILRSLAHEMIHFHQDIRGDLQGNFYEGEDYAQKDKHLREMEREAYEKGNLLFRDWEDSRKTSQKNPKPMNESFFASFYYNLR